MKLDLNKSKFLLILIFVISLSIRLYQLSFFEYKNDQCSAISLGSDTRAAHFLITHGMRSGLGLNNPPFFPYVMGVLTTFTTDPAKLTICFFFINLLALILAIIYFYRTLPEKYALLSTAFLALFPAFTIYSSNIWAQCLLPIIMILFNILLYRFIKFEFVWNFFYMCILVVLAAQIHGSGFMLLPLLILLAVTYWKKIDKKIILLALLTTTVLFIPYLINLFKDRELSNLIAYGLSLKQTFHWKILTFHLRMVSYDFFRSYFKYTFNETLQAVAGGWAFVLYPLAFIPCILFIVGFTQYLRWLIKGRLFDKSEGILNEHPLPFQISGLMIIVVTVGYIIFRIPTSMHYCIILFPAYSIITGFAAFKIWTSSWGKCVVLLGILSTVILFVSTLLFLDKAGGHPYEYGISYKTLISWQKEIKAMKRPGECIDLKVNFESKDISDAQTVLSVLNKNNSCASGDKIIPVQININWNNKLMRYDHLLLSSS